MLEVYHIVRLYECVYEAVPQGVLQLVFTLKVLQTDANYDLTIVVLSLIGSLYSIMHRFMWADKKAVNDDAIHLNCKEKGNPCLCAVCVCVSFGFWGPFLCYFCLTSHKCLWNNVKG